MLKLKHRHRAHPGSLKNFALLFVCASPAPLCLLTLDAAARKSAGNKPHFTNLIISEAGKQIHLSGLLATTAEGALCLQYRTFPAYSLNGGF